MKLSRNINKEYLFSKDNNVLKLSKIGIEKESLRVLNSRISNKPHDSDLFGSPLLNKFITTDFSESLLEFITPPYKEHKKTLKFLDSVHQNVSNKFSKEILWPLSMPPFIDKDSNIPIAYYGNSDEALFKKVYRNGLSNRYGRQMQTIAGIHYNYSLDDELLTRLFSKYSKIDYKEKNTIYFGALRNLLRFNWLLLFLFGASPFVSKNIVGKNDSRFYKLDEKTFFMPFATSLRMSDIGYQNTKQSDLNISFNSLEHYIKGLRKATKTHSKYFENISHIKGQEYPQINSNILQIEDEYYSTSRPKSSMESDDRMINKLDKYGVNYIELRSIDLNPFQATGIDIETMQFLEIFILYCMFKPSPKISKSRMSDIRKNDLLVSTKGRQPGLKLLYEKKSITLDDWAIEVLNELQEFACIIDSKNSFLLQVISDSKLKVFNKDLTLSSQVLNGVKDKKLSYEEFGMALGKAHRDYYKKTGVIDRKSNSIIEKEISASIKKEKQLKSHTEKSFKKYLESYFN